MITWRHNARLVYFVALAAAFLAGFYLHGTSLPAQSQEYFQTLLKAHTSYENPEKHGSGVTPDPSLFTSEHPQVLPSRPTVDPPSDPSSDTTIDKPVDPSYKDIDSGYASNKEFFQAEVLYEFPKFDVAKLRTYAPRNYKGPGREAFATFYLSRNASMQDPYYMATLQVVYRLLWDPVSRSSKHPVVVFVAPFVTDEQRSYFEASGAIVREVASHPFVPNQYTKGPVAERLKDVFSKLEMWNQTDFSRIAYLDSDAFPLINIDMLLSDEVVPTQKCNITLLAKDEQLHDSDECDYCFGAVHESSGMMNAGVMVLKPSQAMHSILLREYHDGSNFNNGFVEQALLTYVFRQNGPFPPTTLGEAWNGAPQVRDNGRPLFILHAKIWVLFFKVNHWASSIWEDTWSDLGQLYEDPAFERIRAQDNSRAHPDQHETNISKWNFDD